MIPDFNYFSWNIRLSKQILSSNYQQTAVKLSPKIWICSRPKISSPFNSKYYLIFSCIPLILLILVTNIA